MYTTSNNIFYINTLNYNKNNNIYSTNNTTFNINTFKYNKKIIIRTIINTLTLQIKSMVVFQY
jgi:predicted proteasome-type protease